MKKLITTLFIASCLATTAANIVNASSCNTHCYWIGDQQYCQTNCY